jgi:protease IV
MPTSRPFLGKKINMFGRLPTFLALMPYCIHAWDSPLPFSYNSAASTSQAAFTNPAAAAFGEGLDGKGSEIGLSGAEWETNTGAIQRLWAVQSQSEGHAAGFRYLSGSGPYQARLDFSWAQNWGSWLSPGIRLSYISAGNAPDHAIMDAGLDLRPWRQLILGYWGQNLWTGGSEERIQHAALALKPLASMQGAWNDFQLGLSFSQPENSPNHSKLFSQLPLFPGLRFLGDWDWRHREGSLALVFQIGSQWAAGFSHTQGTLGEPLRGPVVARGQNKLRANQFGLSYRQDQRMPNLSLSSKVVELDLNRTIVEGPTVERWFGANSELGFMTLLEQFDVLDADPSIKSVILKLGRAHCGWAIAEEMRRRIVNLKSRGKHVVAYLEQVSPLNYFLASAADMVALQPQGYFAVIGLSAEVTFYRGFFDKVGVEPQFLRHGKFKSFEEPYMRHGFSEPARTDLAEYLTSLWDHYLEVVSVSRKLSKDSLRNILESGEISLDHARKFGLIDTLVQADQVLKLAGGKHATLIKDLPEKPYRLDWDIPPKIAVVTVTGNMVSGESGRSWLAGPDLAGSESVAQQLRKARLTPGVRAVVLRVDSPGGSAQAADIMAREVDLLQQANIPVVASVGHNAASGGYYLICGADKIFAEPNSTVGSIGVLWGKFILKGLYDKLGLNVETVKTSSHADGNSMNRSWDSTEVDILQKYMDQFYSDFITKVAAGRHKSKEAIDSLGQGRIFTGSQAVKNGLVDALGGLEDAITSAAGIAGLKSKHHYTLEFILPNQGGGSLSTFSREWSLAPKSFAALEAELLRMKSLAEPRLWALSPELSGWLGSSGASRE